MVSTGSPGMRYTTQCQKQAPPALAREETYPAGHGRSSRIVRYKHFANLVMSLAESETQRYVSILVAHHAEHTS